MRPALLLVLLAAGLARGAAVHDPGEPALRGVATDLVERAVVLDLWDAGEPPRTFALRVAPDGDPVPAEARARPLRGPPGPWAPVEGFRLTAQRDARAAERGWDGLYEVALRARLPNQPSARLALLLVEEPPGRDAVALTTRLEAVPLALRAWTEAGPEGPWLAARVEGPKAPARLEAHAGARAWPLAPGPGAWRAPWPPAGEVAMVARFADGGVLQGPSLPAPEGPWGPAPHAPPVPGGAGAPLVPVPLDAPEPPGAAGPGARAAADAPPRAPKPLPAGGPISLAAAAALPALLLARRRV